MFTPQRAHSALTFAMMPTVSLPMTEMTAFMGRAFPGGRSMFPPRPQLVMDKKISI